MSNLPNKNQPQNGFGSRKPKRNRGVPKLNFERCNYSSANSPGIPFSLSILDESIDSTVTIKLPHNEKIKK